MTNIVLEILRASICIFIVAYLLRFYRDKDIKRQSGRGLIVWGFLLMACGALLDITDNFDELNRLLIVGDTGPQALLEGLFYLSGIGCLAMGFVKQMPSVKKSAELHRELEAREKNYRILFETIREGLITTDRSGLITYANDRMQVMIGESGSDLTGRNLSELVSGDQSPASGTLSSMETVLKTGEGKKLPVLASRSPIFDDNGTITGELIAYTDISEIKSAQRALKVSEEFHRAIFENLSVGIGLIDFEGNWVSVNRAGEKLLGIPHSDLVGTSYFSGLPPSHKLEAIENIRKLVLGEIEQLRIEREYIKPDKTRIVGDISVSIIRGEADEPSYILGVLNDITQQRKLAESIRTQLDELETFNRRLLTLQKISNLILQDKPLNQTLDQIVADVSDLTGFPIVVIESFEPARSKMVFMASTGIPVDNGNRSFEVDTNLTLSGIPAKSGEVLIEHDPQSRSEYSDDALRRLHVQTFVCIPMIQDSGVSGVLSLGHTSKVDVTEQEIEWLKIVANTVAILSDKKLRQEQTTRNEERLRLAMEITNDGIWDWDVTKNHFHRSPNYFRMLGFEKEFFPKKFKDWAGLIHHDDMDRVLGEIDSLKNGRIEESLLEFRFQSFKGDYRWLLSRSRIVGRLNDGSVTRIVGTHTDITNRKHTEKILQESEERYRKLVNLSPDGILVHDGSVVVMTNPAAALILGANTPGELIGYRVLDLVHQDYRHPVEKRISSALDDDRLQPMVEETFLRLDGSSVDVEASAVPIRTGTSNLVQVTFRDITARLLAQQSLRRLATAVGQSAESIMITNAAGLIEYVNPAFEKTSGFSADDVLGKTPSILKSGLQNNDFYAGLWNRISSGMIWKGRLINKRKDGTLFHEEATISPVRSDSGEITNYVAVKRDITQEVEMQKQLIHSQKIQAIGTLAGGIAHDFNNLLQITQGYSELLLSQMSDKDRGYQEISKISLASQRGSALVKRLLTFSRKIEPNKKPVDLNQLIVQTTQLLERTIPKMINVRLDLDSNIRTINADSAQIEQVLMNLAINARDAMPDGGDLVIATSNVVLGEQSNMFQEGLYEGDYVLVKVSDTGQGMEPEIIDRIFEPFFTTKEVGAGAGLGLPTVFGIVKQHGGAILCDSVSNVGTTFRIYLPSMEYSVERSQRNGVRSQTGGSETVLIVDDEDFVRELAGEVLKSAGYSVLLASNGIQALQIIDEQYKDIDLILLDLIMPGLSGKSVLREIMTHHENAKVIVASGFSGGESEEMVMSMGAAGFINKPYENNYLLARVREALDKPQT